MVKSPANEVYGDWLSYEAQMALPTVKRDFDMNRDPHIAAQLRDMDKTEAERRRALLQLKQQNKAQRQTPLSKSQDTEGKQSGGSGSFKPNQGWLIQQRDQSFASYQQYQKTTPQSQEQDNAQTHQPRHTPRYSMPSP